MTADSTLGRVIESPEDITGVVDVSIRRWGRWNQVLKKTAKNIVNKIVQLKRNWAAPVVYISPHSQYYRRRCKNVYSFGGMKWGKKY